MAAVPVHVHGQKYDEPAIESGLEMLEEIAGFTSAADEPSGAIAAANSTSDETRGGENGSPSCPRSFWR